ncbi:hypothetical protein O6H91_15G001200 [Diphasiastrum complanatum]|uniref:Uncharacterized protein n=1 Tax=Diphasiastrum complanatum TaxID=34168 RepID=A0ACC2BF87_DIPCM|nr:hypothetical protein O6H91_15G001200 [Diphasiastrum complanatum]
MGANCFLLHFGSRVDALEILLASPFRLKSSMVSTFKFSKNFSLLNADSISLPIHLSLPFFPAKFKCLLLSSLGEVIHIEDDFIAHFSPHVKACIFWNLSDGRPSQLNIFDGDAYFEQPICFDSLPFAALALVSLFVHVRELLAHLLLSFRQLSTRRNLSVSPPFP